MVKTEHAKSAKITCISKMYLKEVNDYLQSSAIVVYKNKLHNNEKGKSLYKWQKVINNHFHYILKVAFPPLCFLIYTTNKQVFLKFEIFTFTSLLLSVCKMFLSN